MGGIFHESLDILADYVTPLVEENSWVTRVKKPRVGLVKNRGSGFRGLSTWMK